MPLLTNYSSRAVKKYLNSMIMLKFIWVKLDLKTSTNHSTTKPTWAIILVLIDGARVSLNEHDWSNIFKSLKNVCKENKLREFHFKFIHRIIVNSCLFIPGVFFNFWSEVFTIINRKMHTFDSLIVKGDTLR